MFRLNGLLFFMLLAGCARSGTYRIELAPEVGPKAGAPALFLAPFSDGRRVMEIHEAREKYNDVRIDAAGTSLLASGWLPLRKGDLGPLWHRQLAFEMDALGFSVIPAAEPLGEAEALSRAAAAGAAFVMAGELESLRIDKRGHDPVFGTNFSGTNYSFRSRASYRLLAVPSAALALTKTAAFTRVYYNPERLGAPDRETFPHYFSRGLPEAARALASDPVLRTAVGLPTLTPTPTATATPEVKAPTPGQTPLLTPTPAPTEEAAHWVCPKDGKRMDPSWEICPFDGTKRKDFIFKRK